MALEQRGVILTLGDGLEAMAPYAGGSVPADTDPQYTNWVRWLRLGQQDMYNRGFWGRDLVKAVITITANEDEIDLPDDFGKRNGIYVLNVDGEDWNANYNESGQRLLVYLDTATNPFKWKCKFVGYTPTATVTDAELWYFKNPPAPEEQDDEFAYDGETIMFYALKEYFRKARQPGSLDDARVEYENRREELLALEMLPTPQEIMSWSGHYQNIGQHPNERQFYLGNRARRR